MPGHSLRIAIADNGRGMAKANPRGKGLDSMTARALSIGGKLDLHSAPGGVTLLLDLPPPSMPAMP
jgi:signal transduction histidine kinase